MREKVLFGKPERTKHLYRPRHIWKVNVTMDIMVTVSGDEDGINSDRKELLKG
jgi:hypothetical protein